MRKISLFFIVLLIAIMMCVNCIAQSSDAFKEVKIGKQIWIKNNLNVDHFSNGDPIKQAKTAEEWNEAEVYKFPAWCYYNNDPANGEKYGKIYNWYAVNDPRGLAPQGWHIPNDDEWKELIDFLGGEESAGTKMKTTSGWFKGTINVGSGTNSSGFSGQPSGIRINYRTQGVFDEIPKGSFNGLGSNAQWWSSTEWNNKNDMALYRGLSSLDGAVFSGARYKADGLYVRCIKNNK